MRHLKKILDGMAIVTSISSTFIIGIMAIIEPFPGAYPMQKSICVSVIAISVIWLYMRFLRKKRYIKAKGR